MKAIVRFAAEPKMMDLRDVPEPSLDNSKDHAIVEVAAVGICGRDIEHFNSRLKPEKVPYIPGHEFSGVIKELPRGIETGYSVGDRITSETVASVCGNCNACKRGHYNLCKKRKNIGGGMNGAFSRLIKVPIQYLHKLSENVSFEAAAMVEPTCVCYNAAIVNSSIKAGDMVAIIGSGTIGLLCLQMAKLSGAVVALIGLPQDASRMEIARKLGADYLLQATENPGKAILDMTNNEGAPLVIDTVGGVDQTVEQSLEIVSPGGQITKIGWFMKSSSINLDPLIRKNVTLRGSFSHNHNIWERCIKLISSGRIDVNSMISRVMPLNEWQEAFELLSQRKALKIILNP